MDITSIAEKHDAHLISYKSTSLLLCFNPKSYFATLENLIKEGFTSKFVQARAQLDSIYSLLPKEELIEITEKLKTTEEKLLKKEGVQGYTDDLLKELLEDQAFLDDQSNALVSFIRSFCKIAIQNKLGRRAIFVRGTEKIYIFKVYLIKDELTDELVTLKHYILPKLYQIFTGSVPELPENLTKESFITFWKDNKIDELLTDTCGKLLETEDYSGFYTTYTQEFMQKDREKLVKNTKTYKIMSEKITVLLKDAQITSQGIFNSYTLSDKEKLELIQYIAQDIQKLIQNIKVLPVATKHILYTNDIGVFINQTFITLKTKLTVYPEIQKSIIDYISQIDTQKEMFLQNESITATNRKGESVKNFDADMETYSHMLEVILNKK